MPHWSVEVFDHVGDQRSALGNLLKTGDYSDLVIICGQERHKVHKAIVCPRSSSFKVACGSGCKEAQIGAIELPNDDPFAVSMMIEYLYHQTYTLPYDVKLVPMYQRSSAVPFPPGTVPLKITRHSVSGDSSANQSLLHPLRTAATSVRPPQERASHDSYVPYVNLYVHYKVYTLGEKYGIAGLKALAVRNFETEGEKELGSSSVNYFGYLIHMMKEAYNCTAEGDRPLRGAVVRMLKSKPNLFERSDMKESLKEEGLAYDLAMSYVQEDQEKK
ncbi:kelch 4 [Fusarium denticulatum]|uniref:Kelch 4 n=1 Tax=Fusarium denticulatum TaxID=48507 RepID=A0A8H5UJ18_9HYPO|nr:kelch 4 [Fusarium denticulatum]